jgi:hypothetical protein
MPKRLTDISRNLDYSEDPTHYQADARSTHTTYGGIERPERCGDQGPEPLYRSPGGLLGAQPGEEDQARGCAEASLLHI